MIMDPDVSIIIPVYNAEKYLRSCLDSAIGQTFENLEIVCVDDASTDSSLEIIREYEKRDSRIKYIANDSNKGEGASRNTGIGLSSGKYVAHLDADDTLPTDAIDKLFSAASLYGSELVKGGIEMVWPDGRRRKLKDTVPDELVINTSIYKSEFLQRIPISHQTFLYSRDLLEKHRIRYREDLVLGLDLLFQVEALVHAHHVTLLTDYVYNYHQSENSITRSEVTVRKCLDAVRFRSLMAETLMSFGCEEGAIGRLTRWEYFIDTYWKKGAENLSFGECAEVFDAFRQFIKPYDLVPWDDNTTYYFRYILALVLAGLDQELYTYLRTTNASEPFIDVKARSELKKVRKDLYEARAKLDEARSNLRKARKNLRHSRSEMASLHERLNVIYSSTSWRLTRPLRWASRKLSFN